MRFLPVVLRLAARNVRAYRRRSVETFVVVFAGVLAIATADAFLNGFADRVIAGFGVADGHVRVSAPGYDERKALCPLDRLVPDLGGLGEAAGKAALAAARGRAGARAFEGVVALPTLMTALTLQSGGRSVSLYAAGADPWTGGGTLAPPFRSATVEAGRLPGRGESGIVLSASTAARLDAKPGDLLVLLAADAYGSFSMAELALLGVTRADPGPAPCLVDLASMRTLLGVDAGASGVALFLVDARGAPVDPRRSPEAVAAMASAAAGRGLVASAWDAPGGPAKAMMAFYDSFVYAMYAIFVIVAAAGIANSVLLSVQDRTRDFATLRAVAFSARWVKAIVAFETLIVGACASLAAVVLSFAIVAAVGPEGIVVPPSIRGITDWLPATVPARVEPSALALIFLGGSLAPLAAAAYPLRVLGRLKIREGLGYI